MTFDNTQNWITFDLILTLDQNTFSDFISIIFLCSDAIIIINQFLRKNIQMKKIPRHQVQHSDDEYHKSNEEDKLIKSSRKDKSELYKCGDQSCGKFYHSYTAFYNHCKKSHQGEFPENSQHNEKLFEGPSKNRGRPRIKKNQTKDQVQIESMKRENQLIQFLGTLKTKKAEELIVYVESPIDRMSASVNIVLEWLARTTEKNEKTIKYLKELEQFNQIVCQNDLPEFYDPVEVELYADNLDSYNFTSMYKFMTRPDMRERFKIKFEGIGLMYKIHIVWLARILSEKLLAEVIYTILQVEFQMGYIKEKQLMLGGKAQKFKEITEKYFNCFMKEREILIEEGQEEK